MFNFLFVMNGQTRAVNRPQSRSGALLRKTALQMSFSVTQRKVIRLPRVKSCWALEYLINQLARIRVSLRLGLLSER